MREQAIDRDALAVSSPDATMGPFACFAITLVLVVALRLITIFSAIVLGCTTTEQFWYHSVESHWPLAGSFGLALFLLLFWNFALMLDVWHRSHSAKLLVAANYLMIIASLYSFTGMHKTIDTQYRYQHDNYDWLVEHPSWFSKDSQQTHCKINQQFSGRWQVIERTIGQRGFNLPHRQLTLMPTRDMRIGDPAWQFGDDGAWMIYHSFDTEDSRPVIVIDDGQYRSEGSYWSMELRDDLLILETPTALSTGADRSVIVLKRLPD